MLRDHFLAGIEAARGNGDALDAIAKALWAAYGAGEFDDAGATEIDLAIRAARRRPAGPARVKAPKVRLTTPERAARIARRRRWAASSAMPARMAEAFTQGQQAALAVIGRAWADRAVCDWPVARIAALAGCGPSTVRSALRLAERLGLVRVAERRVSAARSRPNLVWVTGREWWAWLRRGGGFKKSKRKVDEDVKTASPDAPPGAGGARAWAACEPPPHPAPRSPPGGAGRGPRGAPATARPRSPPGSGAGGGS